MSDANNLDDLKDKLGALLKGDSTNFQGIAEAAAEIAKREPDVVRFTTDAGMVRRLGQELVAKQETKFNPIGFSAHRVVLKIKGGICW